MVGERVATHDQVINLVGVEQREQISEVGLYFHELAFANNRRRPHVPRVICSASKGDPVV